MKITIRTLIICKSQWLNTDRGRRVKKSPNFADVICGLSLKIPKIFAPEHVGSVGTLVAAVLPPPLDRGQVVVELPPPLRPPPLDFKVPAAVRVARVDLVVLVEGCVLLPIEEGEPVALRFEV